MCDLFPESISMGTLCCFASGSKEKLYLMMTLQLLSKAIEDFGYSLNDGFVNSIRV